jgi:hypothetical protein
MNGASPKQVKEYVYIVPILSGANPNAIYIYGLSRYKDRELSKIKLKQA